jgi:MFS family permease
MVVGPFFSVYLVVDLGGTPTQIGLLAAANSVTNIIGQRLWGRLNDRRGAAWVMRITGLFIPLVPLLWAFAPDPWFLIPVEILSGFLWSGYGLASFNLLLSLAPPAQRARFSAIYQTAVFSAAFVGPLLGSVFADSIGIRPLLYVSTVGRVIASLLFLFTVRGDTETPREG